MDLPELVADRLDDEPVAARVDIDGDAVITTPTRTLRYYTNGLLRDESVEEFSHDVERVDVAETRRKATIRLSNPEDHWEFTIPRNGIEEVLEGVMTGILRNDDVVEANEPIRSIYRFSELTLVVTDARLLKHLGDAVWESDHEAYPFVDVTGLDFEEGEHSTQLVVEIDGRPHRIKLPTDASAGVRRTVEQALFDFYDVDSLDGLNAAVGLDEDEQPSEPDAEPSPTDETDAEASPAEEVLSLDGANSTDDEEPADTGSLDVRALERRLESLETQLENQNELLERQQEAIEQLVEELRRGR